MRRQSKRNTRRGPGRFINLPPVPPSSSVSYTGRIPTQNSESGTLVTLRNATSLATGVGVTQTLLVQNVDVTSFDNFSEYSTVFQEYRVLGIRYQYIPREVANITGLDAGLLVNSILHTAITPTPGNITEAYSYGDSKIGSGLRAFVREWRMTEVDEAKWLDTNSAGTHKGIMLFLDQATANFTYGVLFMNALVQFRTTRK